MKNHNDREETSEQKAQDMPLLSQHQIDEFDRDGAICLRGVLSPEQIEMLREGIEFNLNHLSTLAKVASEADDPGHFVEDFCTWQQNPHYRDFIFQSEIGMIAGLLMNSNVARLYHDHLLVKETNTRQATPWHQDQPYYNVDGNQNCSMWIPVDPISRAATLEFIAGSHKGPWRMPRSFRDNQAKWFPEGTLTELPDIENDRGRFPIIGWEVEPGDIVCFHMLTLHAAGSPDPGKRRRVFSVRFLGDDATHAPRRWTTSPPFEGLDEELPAGAPMVHALFPILWSKTGDEFVD